jgi:hypothetical protein
MLPELSALLDKQAITEVIYRYCRAVDRLDESLLIDCFHPDSVHEQGGFAGPSAQFCIYALARLRTCESTQHHVGNILIELDGDQAHSEAYWVAYHRIAPGNDTTGLFAAREVAQDLFVGGRYIDRFERRNGYWRIVARHGVYDWQRYETAAEGDFKSLPAARRGTRGPTDRAYWRG